MLTSMLQDMRYAWRGMIAHPAFTGVVVATLALGIGANTAIFSVVHGVLLRALPYSDAQRIVHIGHAPPFQSVSEPEFVDYKGARTLGRVSAFHRLTATLIAGDEPEQV